MEENKVVDEVIEEVKTEEIAEVPAEEPKKDLVDKTCEFLQKHKKGVKVVTTVGAVATGAALVYGAGKLANFIGKAFKGSEHETPDLIGDDDVDIIETVDPIEVGE